MLQVGVGGWGLSWLGVVLASPAWELTGVVELNPEASRHAAIRHAMPSERFFPSLAEATAAVEADAALVAVPPDAHAKVVLEALELGLHCLVEKPIAPTVAEARAMVRAAEERGRTLMVSQNYRWRRAPQTVRRLVASGAIGKVGAAFVDFHKAPVFTGFRTTMPHPLITDMAIHHFDLMRGLLGLEPATVVGASWNPTWSRFRGDASASLVFTMDGGARVVYSGSWASKGWDTSWDGEWHVQGSEGEIHWAGDRIEVLGAPADGAGEPRRALAELVELPAEDRAASLAELRAAIDEGREAETSGRANLVTLAMVVAARAACERGEAVGIADVLTGDVR